ncbi:MAG: hypothetical protein V4581_16635 [Bacteroidota bacterium]
MKNLFLTAALVIALSANANDTKTYNTPKEITQEKEYKKIEASALPSAIVSEIKAKYTGYTISEVYAAADGSDYKFVVSKDTDAATVWYTAAGEFIKEEKKS